MKNEFSDRENEWMTKKKHRRNNHAIHALNTNSNNNNRIISIRNDNKHKQHFEQYIGNGTLTIWHLKCHWTELVVRLLFTSCFFPFCTSPFFASSLLSCAVCVCYVYEVEFERMFVNIIRYSIHLMPVFDVCICSGLKFRQCVPK